MTLIFRRGKNLYGFEIDLNNVPGALAAVTSVAHSHRLNISYIEILSYTEETYSLFMVLDFSDVEMDPSQVQRDQEKKEVCQRRYYITCI
jgi:predicted amino acid-binding ACT domain protein